MNEKNSKSKRFQQANVDKNIESPRFKTANEKKRFSDKSHKNRDESRSNAKQSQGKTFRSKSDGGRTFIKQHESKEDTQYVWQASSLSATKAGKNVTGSVQVRLKRDISDKKKGALSPRAPEKIRKNRDEEMKIYGENACLARFKQAPESIVRLWATVEMSHRLGEQLSFLASQRKVYHIVSHEEMTLVSGSEHHGGICLLVKKSPVWDLECYLQTARLQDCVLILDNIQNAYTLGAIMRVAAFYKVGALITTDITVLQNATAARVAEGGMEYLQLLQSASLNASMARLKASHYQLLTLTDDKKATALNAVSFADKVAFVLSENPSRDIEQTLIDEHMVLSFDSPLSNGANSAVNAGILLSRWYFR